MTETGLDSRNQHNPMIINIIIRFKKIGLKSQYIVNVKCETEVVLGAIRFSNRQGIKDIVRKGAGKINIS